MSHHTDPILVNNVDIHVTNTCNLKCFGCNHLADFGYGGAFTADELIHWITPWKKRLFFKRISLMGGEPLLNPHLKDICIGFRQLFTPEETKLRIITNGIRIIKCPWLKELIQDYHVHVQASLHVVNGKNVNGKLVDQVKEGLTLLEKWAEDTPNRVETNWGPLINSKEKLNFQVFYSTAGNAIKPFNHDDIVESKKHCTCKTLQLYKSQLFKCAPIAYIGEALKKIGKENDPN
jgi:organic radical activating enzyme